MTKRMLLIADTDTIWTMKMLQYLLLPQGYEVVLFPIWGNKGKYADFYRESGVTIYEDCHNLGLIGKIPRVRMWARIALNANKLKKMGPFDVVQNCYLSQRDLSLGKRLAKRFKAHWICSFWGSDLMRASARSLQQMKLYLDECDVISVHNEKNVDMIRSAYGEAAAKKTHLIYFGQTGYADIDEAVEKHGRERCREFFGIKPENLAVSLGYSASSAQQQLEALEAIAKMPEERLRRLTLILQQTYGENDPDYIRKTRELTASLPCQTVVLTQFMGPEESAMLRLSADVFVQSIKTDAFSASMQEYLYAGACVLQGAWLDYPQLKEMNIALHPFSAFDQLPALIEKAMDGEIKGLTEEERALFPRLYSWDAVRDSWLEMYP